MATAPLRRTTRSAVSTAALSCAVVVLAGCGIVGSGGGSAGPSGAVPTGDITARIQSTLAQRPDVATAKVWYKDTFEDPASANVNVTMKPGADPAALSAEAVRLVWQSRLNPLDSIAVSVIDTEQPTAGVSRILNLLDPGVRDPLQQQYGPHPR